MRYFPDIAGEKVAPTVLESGDQASGVVSPKMEQPFSAGDMLVPKNPAPCLLSPDTDGPKRVALHDRKTAGTGPGGEGTPRKLESSSFENP